MDYSQFKNLLQLKGLNDKEAVPMLEELIEKFPYFQSARALLAKAMHDQENINYNDALKLAAAYATDREALRELVEPQTIGFAKSFPSHNGVITNEAKQSSIIEEETFEEYYSEDEISGRALEEQKEKEKIVDPYEVIRKRLSEILVIKEEPEESRNQESRIKNQDSAGQPLPIEKTTSAEKTPEPKNEKPIVEEVQTTIHSEKSDSENIIIQEAGKAHDVLDRMEVEHAMEESILASLEKLPVITAEKAATPIPQFDDKKITIKELPVTPTRFSEEAGNSEPKSFTKWLKAISNKPFHQFEEVHLGEPKSVAFELQEESHSQTTTTLANEPEENEEDLIDRFIATEPRIIPSKAEFYSPANQARKSVMENEDVLSETLARIYRGQGNLAKAKWCYEKLSLLHPEKSVYFAALIEEIKNEELKIKN